MTRMTWAVTTVFATGAFVGVCLRDAWQDVARHPHPHADRYAWNKPDYTMLHLLPAHNPYKGLLPSEAADNPDCAKDRQKSNQGQGQNNWKKQKSQRSDCHDESRGDRKRRGVQLVKKSRDRCDNDCHDTGSKRSYKDSRTKEERS